MSKLSSRGAVWGRLRLAALERDNWTCQHCGNELRENDADAAHDATVDHITPKAAGGRDEMTNLIASCRRCNGIKSDRVGVRVDWLNPEWFGRAA